MEDDLATNSSEVIGSSLSSGGFNRERWKFVDPNQQPARKGLLLSNEIERFCDQHLLISEEYEKKQLRPAAYTLRIGADFVDSKGKQGKLTRKHPSFYLEPNSIAYVSTLEELDLPYYVAARFNLRVKWVYKGVLLGTGPQVEPGYRGALSCPLYNLTQRAIKVTLKEDFATIDFERTSDFCPGMDWADIKNNMRQSSDVPKLNEVRTNDDRFLMFAQDAYRPLQLLPEWDVVSSLVQLSNEVKTWRAIGIAILIAFFGLALALLTFQSNLYRELRIFDSQLSETRQSLEAARAKLQALEGSGNIRQGAQPVGPGSPVLPPAKVKQPSTGPRR